MKARLSIAVPTASLLAFFAHQWPLCAQSSPVQLTLKGSWTNAAGPVRKAQVVGPHAYLVVGETGLQVLDVSSPTNPLPLGRYDAAHRINGFHVVEHHAYLATGDSITQTNDPGMLEVLNVTQPTNLVRLSGTTTPGRANNVYVTEDLAYVAEGTWWTGSNLLGALRIFSVTNPANPSVVGHLETSAAVYGVQSVGNYAYLAGGDTDLLVVDVSRPQQPVVVGNFETNSVGGLNTIRVIDRSAYVWREPFGRLIILDVMDPAHPSWISTVGGNVQGADLVISAVAMNGSYRCLAWGVKDTFGCFGTTWLTLQDTSSGVLLGHLDLGSACPAPFFTDFQMADNVLYAATSQHGLLVFEIVEWPYLKSISISEEKIVLAWNDLPGLKLQRTPSLVNPDWTDVPGSLGTNRIELPRDGDAGFFRLAQPATP